MRIVLHAGMHKTGSSSIQETFFRKKSPDLEYADWAKANHSSLMVLLFQHENKLRNYHSFYKGGLTEKKLVEWKLKTKETLDEQIRNSSASRFLFSAEDVSEPSFVEEEVDNIKNYLSRFTTDINVIAYVRPPVSFMQSVFQQKVKRYMRDLDMDHVWPCYKRRFEKFDSVFGRDNVTLRDYGVIQSKKTDVVDDFCNQVGISICENEKKKVNEGLSLEATCFLFLRNKFGAEALDYLLPRKSITARMKKHFLDLRAKEMEGVGSHRVIFSDELVAPVIERNREDIQWMEKRLGNISLISGRKKHDGPVIDKEEDIIDIAAQSRHLLLEMLRERRKRRTRILLKRVWSRLRAMNGSRRLNTEP